LETRALLQHQLSEKMKPCFIYHTSLLIYREKLEYFTILKMEEALAAVQIDNEKSYKFS
jgi:hypothetical protein